MDGVKCKKCGYIDYLKNVRCKKCSTPLGDYVPHYLAQDINDQKKSKLEDKVRNVSFVILIGAIILTSAIVGLAIYNLLPQGRYPIQLILVPVIFIDAIVFAILMSLSDVIEEWIVRKMGY